MDGIFVLAAHGAHRPAGASAGNVVRHPGGRAGGAGHACPTTIPWKLLQGIALVQLYLEERWVEPPRLDRLPFSLLYHQTMSTLASCGELSPRALADRVLRLHYFHRITQEDYRVLLRHLIATDHIQQTEQGGLIVGLAGERVINSFKFYGVFQESEEYTVRSESQELGTVVSAASVGEKLAIAGHVWQVLDVDHKRRLIYCQQVKGSVPAYFGQCPGDLHTKILERMRRVLQEDRQYPYLMKNAVARLEQARFTAAHSGAAEKPAHQSGRQHVVPASMGRDVHLPDHGAVPENQMRRPPRPAESGFRPARFLFSSP